VLEGVGFPGGVGLQLRLGLEYQVLDESWLDLHRPSIAPTLWTVLHPDVLWQSVDGGC
jgi:hypothetical protein